MERPSRSKEGKMIERTSGGMRQTYQNPLVCEIRLLYSGDCMIRFADGTIKTAQIPSDPLYVAQYGIPLSEDGKFMAIGSWENGVSVYSTETCNLLWRCRTARIRQVFIYRSCVIAVKHGTGLLQFDLETGRKLREVRSTTVEAAYLLRDGMALVCSIKGKCALVRLEDLAVERLFPKAAINPNHCLSLVITGASAEKDRIIVQGFESWCNGNPADRENRPFQRIL